MIAAQYEIQLPADYDMSVIYHRISKRCSVFDDRAGLGLKAFLVSDVADGSRVNSYAPFYLWNDSKAMAAFHWGGAGFSSIVKDFGRPLVQTWIGGGFVRGVAFGAAPKYAAKRAFKLSPSSDPCDESTVLAEQTAQQSLYPETHSVAWGINPTTWEAVIFRLATMPITAEKLDVCFRVCHLSTPEILNLD